MTVDPGTLGALHGFFLVFNLVGDLAVAAAALATFVAVSATANRAAATQILAGAAGSALVTLAATGQVFLQDATRSGAPGITGLVLVNALTVLGIGSFVLIGRGLWLLPPAGRPSGAGEGEHHE